MNLTTTLRTASLAELRQAAAFIQQIEALTEEYPKFRVEVREEEPVNDPQRRAVYSAEASHSEWKKHRFVCFSELEDYVRGIERSDWYIKNFGPRSIEIKKGSPQDVAARGGLFYICIPAIYRRKMVVLHEVAHAVYWRPNSNAQPHGPSFCAIYLSLVGQFMSEESARELAGRFEKNGVRVAARLNSISLHSSTRSVRRAIIDRVLDLV